MYESPGVFLSDGSREDSEDLTEVETVVRVEGAGVPHHHYKLHRAQLTGELFNPLCSAGNISAKI